MENKMTVRAMKEEDLPQVTAIEKATFSLPWSQQSFADAAKKTDNVYLVCDCAGEIAGYCGMWTVLGEGNITNVAVRDSYRRNGVGKALLQELLKRGAAKSVEVFFLEVRESNEAARHLYENLGFEQIGVRKHFYEKPVENAIIMAHGFRQISTKE